MDAQLFKALLNESESDSLDFKLGQYPFADASDEVKAELVKDVLAMANAWRRDPGYILIGVQEVKGARSVPVGITGHLDDAALQQLVNGKTNQPIAFAYEAFGFEGKQFGIIRVACQKRPFYLIRDFGRLAKSTVYLRRNSSTAIALPDEVARMGEHDARNKDAEPVLQLQFADLKEKKALGAATHLDCIAVVPQFDPNRDLPEYGEGRFAIVPVNKDYYRDVFDCLRFQGLMHPLGFTVKNLGSSLATDVRLQFDIFKRDDITICDGSDEPGEPATNKFSEPIRGLMINSDVTVENLADRWCIMAEFPKIQAKSIAWTSDVFFVGSDKPTKLSIEASLFADTLRSPIAAPLALDFGVKYHKLELDEFWKLVTKGRK